MKVMFWYKRDTMAKRSSLSDLCFDGRVLRMWVQILAATMVLVSLSKTFRFTLLLITQEYL